MHFQKLRLLSLLVRIKENKYEEVARATFWTTHSEIGILLAAVV